MRGASRDYTRERLRLFWLSNMDKLIQSLFRLNQELDGCSGQMQHVAARRRSLAR